jgi:hypothetical protein
MSVAMRSRVRRQIHELASNVSTRLPHGRNAPHSECEILQSEALNTQFSVTKAQLRNSTEDHAPRRGAETRSK